MPIIPPLFLKTPAIVKLCNLPDINSSKLSSAFFGLQLASFFSNYTAAGQLTGSRKRSRTVPRSSLMESCEARTLSWMSTVFVVVAAADMEISAAAENEARGREFYLAYLVLIYLAISTFIRNSRNRYIFF